MQLFYIQNIEKNSYLEKEEFIHATKVLRKKIGDIILVINGKGDLFNCKIIEIASKKCFVEIERKQSFPKTNNLHIAIAPTKNINRLEFFLEKVTEIGITKITPILCARSERKVIKKERLEKILLSASKQSKNFHLPVLNELISFKDFIKKTNQELRLIAHCEEEPTKKTIVNYDFDKEKSVLILIGPEGDFTNQEIELAKENDFQELSLGESRLRTETAGIVSCTLYNSKLN